ncbi:aldo/keto reductase [Aureimonas altamirensis]|uniref:aldo/keto reductase n=1 Tax=Aureimonas altamirensis TaxID=370622 RepID=UPI002036ACDB|nr:aldo/keto reductase [Aureimonas altamirensis]MCM2504218.1 aldo/keto reductase [Aureimonas altamirensis]
MRTIDFADGDGVPAIGQGTWMMAEGRRPRGEEIRALRVGFDLGLTLVDTAEIYAGGASEELVGEAIEGRRDELFIVSKVAPSHASSQGTIRALEGSLKRLRTDRIDLYLLHWRGGFPLSETVAALDRLRADGKILMWGVSNFDTDDMQELMETPGGRACATNQILYNPQERGTEFDLLPWMRREGMPAMAYSPVGQGGELLRHAALARVARRHGVAPAQVALAFAIRDGNMIAIPKAGTEEHVRQNAAALRLHLDADDMKVLDAAFPPPSGKVPLSII